MAIGFAWINYGPEALSQVGLVEGILNMVFAHLEETAQIRIKVVIRILLYYLYNPFPFVIVLSEYMLLLLFYIRGIV